MDNRPQITYSLNDLLLLLGQQTVELAVLRARLAALEARPEHPSPNGTEAMLEPEHA